MGEGTSRDAKRKGKKNDDMGGEEGSFSDDQEKENAKATTGTLPERESKPFCTQRDRPKCPKPGRGKRGEWRKARRGGEKKYRAPAQLNKEGGGCGYREGRPEGDWEGRIIIGMTTRSLEKGSLHGEGEG